MIAHSVLFFIIKVPRQLNGYDCGLYVCQYAAALVVPPSGVHTLLPSVLPHHSGNSGSDVSQYSVRYEYLLWARPAKARR